MITESAEPVRELDKSGRTIRDMFAAVAPRYDLLNRLLSGWLDVWWRRVAARALALGPGTRVLDLCAGTGDQAVAVGKHGPRVAAADFCLPMLALSPPKFDRLRQKGGGSARPLAADALELPFPDASFDGATVSFGLRNVADLDAALAEIHRVLAPGGRVAFLEFAVPRLPVIRQSYLFYFQRICPGIGKLMSDRGSAYSYLSRSVPEFAQRDTFVDAMRHAGLEQGSWKDLTVGIVCLYQAVKPQNPATSPR